MADFILHLVNGVPPLVAVVLLAMAPVVELRAAIPAGVGIYKLPLSLVFPIVVLANMIPALVILYGWDALVSRFSRHWPWLNKIMQKWYLKTELKWNAKIEKYGPVALLLFVAVPLPGSGVWSGALAAWIFGVKRLHAVISILAGVILSAIVVSVLTITGLQLF